jgi:hypothetical protein
MKKVFYTVGWRYKDSDGKYITDARFMTLEKATDWLARLNNNDLEFKIIEKEIIIYTKVID